MGTIEKASKELTNLIHRSAQKLGPDGFKDLIEELQAVLNCYKPATDL